MPASSLLLQELRSRESVINSVAIVPRRNRVPGVVWGYRLKLFCVQKGEALHGFVALLQPALSPVFYCIHSFVGKLDQLLDGSKWRRKAGYANAEGHSPLPFPHRAIECASYSTEYLLRRLFTGVGE